MTASEMRRIAKRLRKTDADHSVLRGAGGAFAVMSLMSDGLKALGRGTLVGNEMSPLEIADALEALAEQVSA